MNVENDDGDQPLHLAARRGHVQAVTTLMQLGADVHAFNAHGHTALHWASTAAVVTLLLEAGADLHRRSHRGKTPLFIAIRNGHASAVQSPATRRRWRS